MQLLQDVGRLVFKVDPGNFRSWRHDRAYRPVRQAQYPADHIAFFHSESFSRYCRAVPTVGKDRLLWVIYLVLAAVTIATESEIAWLFIAAGVLVWFWRAPSKWISRGGVNALAATQLPTVSSLYAAADVSLLVQIALFFAKAGAFVFGSGLAIVPFLYGGGSHRTRMADREAVRRRRCGRHDHTGAGGHYRGLHRVSRRRTAGRDCGRACYLPAVLPVHSHSCALLQEIRQAARRGRFCRRHHRGGRRRHCRVCRRDSQADAGRPSECRARATYHPDPVEVQETTGTGSGCRRGGNGFDSLPSFQSIALVDPGCRRTFKEVED